MNTLSRTALLGAALLTPLFMHQTAQACGGTFCDSGPLVMPVDQSGENVLFVMEEGMVEAHVQIQYEGEAERFAWIVPIQQIPEVTVGSQLLFDALLQGSSPSYGVQTAPDQCDFDDRLDSDSPSAFDGSEETGAGDPQNAGGGPTVVFEKTVGSFEVVALQGGTASEVSSWLDENGYQNVDTAPALLNKYVQKGFVFVALKLTAGADTGEIHPLTFRYPGTEPCVPIELTAVAAVEDMAIRTFFLGDDRVVPTNYKLVEPNPLRLDWLQNGSNYTPLVTRAVDTPVASGHAFVTEYAGASSVIQNGSLFSPSWSSAGFEGIEPERVMDTLMSQGLVNWCDGSQCNFNHPLVASLLTRHLPSPEGLSDADFWSCLDCYAENIDRDIWDSAAFASDVEDRIVAPGRHAQDLLAKYPYLTRMFTTMSPVEMTEDPMFHAQTGLDEVDLRSTLGTNHVACDGDQAMELPDGRVVALAGANPTWPAFDSDMPWAERVWEFTPGQAPVLLVDNSEAIDGRLLTHNKGYGVNGIDEAARVESNRGESSGGCSASGGSTGGSSAALLLALGLIGFRRRLP